MNFNIYNDSVFRKIVSRFSLVTAFAFKTFVLAPCVTFFFFFFLLAYSAGGAGNIITEYIKSVDYNANSNSYRVCMDEPLVPTATKNPAEMWPVAEDVMEQKQVEVICHQYGDVSADKKASILTRNITGYYLSTVVFYLAVLLFVRFFRKPFFS
ncbi:hypothetical protein [Klebsiella pneumoniae]|uniref:hypothetical protein n=1 Tax=Klebsiella pneumoniae TaxID=573 RepID=UPI000E34AFFA|nr:hypothetical protein [Klebsiella pneumoniae]RIU55272.1 hypothetical protein D1615_20905 [Klebsiella pneumoniae]